MYFGTAVWPFKWKAPYDDVVRRIARLGFKGVELIAWNNEVLRDYYTPSKIKDLKELMKTEQIKLTNFNYSLRELSSPEAGVREQDIKDFSAALEVCVALGSEKITTVSAYPFSFKVPPVSGRPSKQEWMVNVENVESGLDWEQNYNHYVEGLTECCTRAAKYGVKVVIEPHPFRWVARAQDMLRLIERTGASNLGFNFDPSHLLPSGDIPNYAVYLLGNRIWNTHLSDNDCLTNAHWRPGKGKCDWKAVFRALVDVGYDDVITLELEDVPGCSNGQGLPDVATAEMDREMLASKAYLTDICNELGIEIS